MIYELKFTPTAFADIEFHKKSGDRVLLKKLYQLLVEISEHPMTGTGKPEKLKYKETNCWSRKINEKHRLVYIIEEEIITVLILQSRGHYTDK
jgi:toxin YoeB